MVGQSNGSPIEYYVIEWEKLDADFGYIQMPDLEVQSNSITLTELQDGLAPDTQYRFRVAGVNALG